MNLSLRLSATLALSLLVVRCAGMPTNGSDVYDPFEKENRVFFDVSLTLDRAVLRPAAVAYSRALPQTVRDSVRNFIDNLSSPVVFANDVLQGDVDKAGTTLFRIGVNTTIGIGGLFDPAKGFGYPRHSNDFGITLGDYGVGEGPYLFIPVLGPSNARDATGYVVDWTFDPFFYIPVRENFFWQLGRTTLDDVDARSRNLTTLDEIQKSSLDFYATVRSLYHQQRESQINGGMPAMQNLPNF